MIKRILFAALLTMSTLSFAQNTTASPYSFGGIGLINYRGTVEIKSMGGMSVFSDSIHTNIQNPATYANLRYTNYSVGGRRNETSLKSDGQSDNTSVSALDYLVVGIPAGKFGASFGLYPYSSVGYELTNVDADGQQVFTGTGGLTKVFLGIGYELMKGLNIGAEAQYNFGNIRNQALFAENNIEFGTQEVNRSDISGLNFVLGAYYKTKVTDKLSLTGSLTFTPESDLSVENFRELATVLVSDEGGIGGAEVVDINVSDSEIQFPSKLSLGLGLGEDNKWFVGGEYSIEGTGVLTNRSFDLENLQYQDAAKVRIGGLYIPKYNSLTSYWSRITYRAGFRFEETGLRINNEDINEFGMSFGLGLPVGKRISNINLGFEYGKRGTTNAGLVEENFINVFISLSLNDKWFIKRKYD
jgi:long-subunit fatty acid transport protein